LKAACFGKSDPPIAATLVHQIVPPIAIEIELSL
jgi:hypothetical protein